MITRELINYEWRYENGEIVLLDKKSGSFFKLPIAYADSLARALITFKTAYRIEQVEHKQSLITRIRETVKLLTDRERKSRGQVKALQGFLKEAKKGSKQLQLVRE